MIHVINQMQRADEIMKDDLKVKEYAICFVDILGYKNLLTELGEDEFLQIIEDAFNEFEPSVEFLGSGRLNLGEDGFASKIEYHIFSDNILFFIGIDGMSDIEAARRLYCLAYFVANIQQSLLRQKILLRGGLTFGKLYYKRGKYIYGSGLMRAYELESTAANFPRVIIDPKVENVLNAKKSLTEKYINLVTMDYSADFYFVNYFRYATNFHALNMRGNTHIIPKIMDWIEGMITSGDIPVSVSAKYRWLKEHLEEARQERKCISSSESEIELV
jgi:hypothetical protein